MKYTKDDTIHIVGAGASGISSAYFLIESGHDPKKIYIYEKTNRIGGHLCTIYFHVLSATDCRIISEYELKNEGEKIYIKFKDHNKKNQVIDLDSDNIVPADMLATVHGREKFHNLYTMAKHTDLLPFLLDDGQHYTTSCVMEDGIHKTSYSKNPLWWRHLYRTHIMLKKIYSLDAKIYMHYNPQLSYGELLRYLDIKFDDPALTAHHSTIPCLFALSIDQIYNVDAKIISESTESIMGNYNKSFTKYGFNVYIILLAEKLKAKGVAIELNYDYFKNNYNNYTNNINASTPKHLIYSCQPWYLPNELQENPIIKPYATNYTEGDCMITHNKFGLDESCINYIFKDNNQYGIADLDKMRVSKKDTGAYIMAQATHIYPVFPESEQKKYKHIYDFYNTHNLNFHEIDGVKRIGIKHTNCNVISRKIDNIQGTYLHGDNGPCVWFSNATYNYLIHEGSWECSMDIICKMTGEEQMLVKKGYQNKHSRARIIPNPPKNILEELISYPPTYAVLLLILIYGFNQKKIKNLLKRFKYK